MKWYFMCRFHPNCPLHIFLLLLHSFAALDLQSNALTTKATRHPHYMYNVLHSLNREYFPWEVCGLPHGKPAVTAMLPSLIPNHGWYVHRILTGQPCAAVGSVTHRNVFVRSHPKGLDTESNTWRPSRGVRDGYCVIQESNRRHLPPPPPPPSKLSINSSIQPHPLSLC